jgi:bacterioferritin-associated ferredoxin
VLERRGFWLVENPDPDTIAEIKPDPVAASEPVKDKPADAVTNEPTAVTDEEVRKVFDTTLRTIADLWTMTSVGERLSQCRRLTNLIKHYLRDETANEPADLDPSATLPEFPPSNDGEDDDLIVIERHTHSRRKGWMDMTFSEILALAPKSENNNNVREYESFMHMLEQLINRGYA